MKPRTAGISKTLPDRIIEYFDPVRGRARLQSRMQLALAGQWIGARGDRRGTKWFNPLAGSADADDLFDLTRLRPRSRALSRNNPLALGAINTVVTNAIGTGLSVQSAIDAEALGMSEDEAQTWQDSAEREFRIWGDNPRACDAAATLDFYGLQSLAFRSALESGDVFAALPMIDHPSSIYSLKVNLIEADRVMNKDRAPDTSELAAGVQRNIYGAPTAYHILRTHPYGLITQNSWVWDVVPAFGTQTGRRNIIHLYDKRRPGQTRGMPYLAPVIEPLKQLGDYTEAEITAAVVSGMFTVFVKTQTGQGLDLDASGNPIAAGTTPKSGEDIRLSSGAIVDLANGEDVSFANPGRPNTAFDPFVLAVLRQIGVALELPFEVLVKHFTASYSAARAALLEAWRFYKGRRNWLATMFCQPIYEAFLEEAVSRGRLDAPGFFDDPSIRAAYCGSEWTGDSPGQIDPEKEVSAAGKRLDLLLTSRAEETAGLTGRDWDDVMDRRRREEQIILDSNLAPTIKPPNAPTPGQVPVSPPPQPDQGDQENQ